MQTIHREALRDTPGRSCRDCRSPCGPRLAATLTCGDISRAGSACNSRWSRVGPPANLLSARTDTHSLALAPRSASAIAERASANWRACAGAGSGRRRLRAPVAGSRSSQGSATSGGSAGVVALVGDASAALARLPAAAITSASPASAGESTGALAALPASSAGATASPSPMRPVSLSTSFMKRLRREPPSGISLWPPSRIPAESERLNASTESIPSSMVPLATKSTICTGRV